MSNSILILGESGVGKSTSIRNLNHKETFIINVLDKPLPFRGFVKKYTPLSKDGKTGNYYATDDVNIIIRVLNGINEKRPDIKNIIIDDFGYILTNSFMRKSSQKGYDKFVDLGKDMFIILEAVMHLRPDLFCFIMMHTEIDQHGVYKPKTIGKMIDQYICIEGKFTICLHAIAQDESYRFLTNADGQHMAKSPMGLFEELYIENDLSYVIDKVKEYNDVFDETTNEEPSEIKTLEPTDK